MPIGEIDKHTRLYKQEFEASLHERIYPIKRRIKRQIELPSLFDHRFRLDSTDLCWDEYMIAFRLVISLLS